MTEERKQHPILHQAEAVILLLLVIIDMYILYEIFYQWVNIDVVPAYYHSAIQAFIVIDIFSLLIAPMIAEGTRLFISKMAIHRHIVARSFGVMLYAGLWFWLAYLLNGLNPERHDWMIATWVALTLTRSVSCWLMGVNNDNNYRVWAIVYAMVYVFIPIFVVNYSALYFFELDDHEGSMFFIVTAFGLGIYSLLTYDRLGKHPWFKHILKPFPFIMDGKSDGKNFNLWVYIAFVTLAPLIFIIVSKDTVLSMSSREFPHPFAEPVGTALTWSSTLGALAFGLTLTGFLGLWYYLDEIKPKQRK